MAVPRFELWLETETGEPLDQPANRPSENFSIVKVTLDDGRIYVMNVWTFDFLPLARFPWPYNEKPDCQPAKYVLPPDLFVENLTREMITDVVTEMLERGEMRSAWLITPEDD